jgi:hypothetical protein
VHERNPNDWIGIAHNRLVDDFRRELKKPGAKPHDACNYIANFVKHADPVPRERRSSPPHDDSKAIQAALATSRVCAGRVITFQAAAILPSAIMRTRLSLEDLSPAFYALTSQIEGAIDDATDSYDLATRLGPILDASASLDSAERDMFFVAASIAQSSFEYWEAQFPSAYRDFVSAYGTCANEAANLGYTSSEALNRCLSGKTTDGAWYDTPLDAGTSAIRYASLSSRDECGHLSLRFRRLVAADFKGGLIGLVLSILLPSPIIWNYALKAAAGASLGSFFDTTWDLMWCAMPYGF